jgi:hypothetical protein
MYLKNWGITTRQDNPYQAPETQACVCGHVYDSQNFNDGDFITTSVIQKLVMLDENTIQAHTQNSIYSLRKENMSPEYEKEFPNAWARLLVNTVREESKKGN